MGRQQLQQYDVRTRLEAVLHFSHSMINKFTIDCSSVISEMELWEKYVDVTCPEGVEHFGYSLAAFNDAITGGGPGWPGECDIYFINTARVRQFRNGAFHAALQRIADDSTNARVHLEDSVSPSWPTRSWWKLW
jgi:hypothetical protein